MQRRGGARSCSILLRMRSGLISGAYRAICPARSLHAWYRMPSRLTLLLLAATARRWCFRVGNDIVESSSSCRALVLGASLLTYLPPGLPSLTRPYRQPFPLPYSSPPMA